MENVRLRPGREGRLGWVTSDDFVRRVLLHNVDVALLLPWEGRKTPVSLRPNVLRPRP